MISDSLKTAILKLKLLLSDEHIVDIFENSVIFWFYLLFVGSILYLVFGKNKEILAKAWHRSVLKTIDVSLKTARI